MTNSQEKIKRPIFIIGTGRCGSTIFYRLMANHPETAFISNLNVKFPNRPLLWRMNTVLGRLPLRMGLLKPSEAYPLFDGAFPGYSKTCRTLGKRDVSDKVRQKTKSLVKNATKYQTGSRFLYKYTGWSRIGFFNDIFFKPLFIHIIRDGRDVAYSLLNVDFWQGWRGPQNWRWGKLPEPYRKEWEQSGRSYSVLAGIQWKMILDEYEESKKEIEDERIHRLRYEDLVKSPYESLSQISDFAGLSWGQTFEQRVNKYDLQSANGRWRENLPKNEKQRLEGCLEGHLQKYGYEV